MIELMWSIDNFSRRIILDAVNEALATTWLYRAEQLEQARPLVDDYHGRASSHEVLARDQRLATQAEACRNHASICAFNDAAELLGLVLSETKEVA